MSSMIGLLNISIDNDENVSKSYETHRQRLKSLVDSIGTFDILEDIDHCYMFGNVHNLEIDDQSI
jgi:hypothetical protein